MPLPENKTPWPPTKHAQRYIDAKLNLTWLGGDPAALSNEYGGRYAGVQQVAPASTGGNVFTRTVNAIKAEFWGTQASGELDTKRHSPVAEDIARTKAELMYAEEPRFTVDGPLYDADGPNGADGKPSYLRGDPKPETVAAQTRLDVLVDKANLIATLLAGAELGAALGCYGLRVAVDQKRIPGRPTIAAVDALHLIPEYSWDTLTAVTYWGVVKATETELWRHLERHEGGRVYHGLYQGTADNLGIAVPLTESTATEGLRVAEDGSIALSNDGHLTGVSIPNALPDPLDLENHAGRSDFTPAVRDLFSAADEFYTRMMESVDDARSRLIIADYLLNSAGQGKGLEFDRDSRMMRRVNMPPSEDASTSLPIEQIQFDMKVAEYLLGFEAMRENAIKAAGYNPQTMGDSGEVAMTATEYAGKNKRSMSTRGKAIRYARPLLAQLLTALVSVDVQEFKPKAADGSLIIAYPVKVEFPAAIQPTMTELVTNAKALKESGGSAEEVVRATYPSKSDAEVRVLAEKRLEELTPVDPLSFGTAGAGL
jgi:hypothetical protein